MLEEYQIEALIDRCLNICDKVEDGDLKIMISIMDYILNPDKELNPIDDYDD